MKKTTIFITRGAIIAALYVALTGISALFGLHNGVIQFRLSEKLTILPVFFPEAILGVTLGCFLSNLITGCVFWDIVFGSIATLIGALGAYLLRRLPKSLMFIATIPTILANALIMPHVLILAYGAPDAYYFLFITVGIGEVVTAGILGYVLYRILEKKKFITK